MVGVGVGGGGGGGDDLGSGIRYLRPPNDAYESKIASPIIRTKMAYKRPRFFKPFGSVGWAPRTRRAEKFFRLGMWLTTIFTALAYLAKTKVVCRRSLLHFNTTKQTRNYHIYCCGCGCGCACGCAAVAVVAVAVAVAAAAVVAVAVWRPWLWLWPWLWLPWPWP